MSNFGKLWKWALRVKDSRWRLQISPRSSSVCPRSLAFQSSETAEGHSRGICWRWETNLSTFDSISSMHFFLACHSGDSLCMDSRYALTTASKAPKSQWFYFQRFQFFQKSVFKVFFQSFRVASSSDRFFPFEGWTPWRTRSPWSWRSRSSEQSRAGSPRSWPQRRPMWKDFWRGKVSLKG